MLWLSRRRHTAVRYEASAAVARTGCARPRPCQRSVAAMRQNRCLGQVQAAARTKQETLSPVM